jgi:hypothetical protein
MNQPKSLVRVTILYSAVFALIVGMSVSGAPAAQDQPLLADIRDTLADSLQNTLPAVAQRGRLEALRVFYSRRDFAPLWTRDGAPTPQAVR